MPTAAEINTARETLDTLSATFPDFGAPERAAHERAYDLAWEAFTTLMDAARRVKAQTMTDDAGKVVTRFGFPVHKDGLRLRISDQWATFDASDYARIIEPRACRRWDGGLNTIRQDGKTFLVTVRPANGTPVLYRRSSYASAFKVMVRW